MFHKEGINIIKIKFRLRINKINLKENLIKYYFNLNLLIFFIMHRSYQKLKLEVQESHDIIV